MEKDARKAIVLGGVTGHIKLINKLKERGFYTILIDYLDCPPAKPFADEHIQISTFDFEEIQKIAKERKVDLIINCCLEHLNKGICKIAENLGLTAPYSYATAVSISDKEIMKERMLAGGIPTSKHICVESISELDHMDLSFPVFVKPAIGSGSNAVTHVFDRAGIADAAKKVLSRYPGSKIIIEEEARGDEYNVYCFPCGGKANVLMVVRRYTDNDSEDHVTKCIGTVGPAFVSEAAYEKIEKTAAGISREFHLDNVPMFLQIMIDGDNINVIEFAGRMAGGFSDRAILETTGFDLYDATINSFLKIPNRVSYTWPDAFITVSGMYASACIFDRLTGYQELLEDHTLVDLLIARTSGTEISEDSSNGSKVGFVIVKGNSLDEMMTRLEKVFDTIDVIDVNGSSKLRRDKRLTREMVGIW